MTILEQALSKIKLLNKNQNDFFIILIQALIGSVGKKTARNLARFAGIAEHTFGRQMTKWFDFVGLNRSLIEMTILPGDMLIAAQDTTFVPKSGKSTFGLSMFWNACKGKAERGLELDAIAVVKLNDEKKEAFPLSSRQTVTPPTPATKQKKKKTDEPTRIDFYLNHLAEVVTSLLGLGVRYMAVDSLYAKIKYITGVVLLGLHAISKLRKDARLVRIYTGPQKARGRKKIKDKGKINADDFNASDVVTLKDDEIELRSCIAYSVALKMKIKIVWVKKNISPVKHAEAFLFSTDLEQDMLQIYQCYVARFQIEFVFRDAKGFTGLCDSQSRDARRLNYHFNASFVALNVAKIQDGELQKKEKVRHPFSMLNWARQYHVEIVVNRIISMFKFDQTLIKLHPDYQALLRFGNVRH